MNQVTRVSVISPEVKHPPPNFLYDQNQFEEATNLTQNLSPHCNQKLRCGTPC